MKTIVPALFAAALLATGSQAHAQSREFDCGGQGLLRLKVLNANTIAAGPIEGRTVALKQSAQPMTYVYGDVRLDIAQDQRSVQLTMPGGAAMNCSWTGASASTTSSGAPQVATPSVSAGSNANAEASSGSGETSAAATQGIRAKSWGGVVRSGPGMDHQRLAGLAEGDPITLLERTDVEMNGYPWFKIRYGRNKTGYQWGGIICPIGKPLPGTFEVCD